MFFVLSQENKGVHWSGGSVYFFFEVFEVREPILYDPLHLRNPQIEICDSANFALLKLEIFQKIHNPFSVLITFLNAVVNGELFFDF